MRRIFWIVFVCSFLAVEGFAQNIKQQLAVGNTPNGGFTLLEMASDGSVLAGGGFGPVMASSPGMQQVLINGVDSTGAFHILQMNTDGSLKVSGGAGTGTVTTSGTMTNGDCVKSLGGTVIADAGAPCGSGGGGGTGTVTSVGMTVPAWLAVAGTPITAAGTLAVSAASGQTSHQVIGTCGTGTSFGPCALVPGDIPTLNQNTTGTSAGISGSQTANFIYAAPNGSAGTAVFRAMVAADVPTLNQNTSGTAANLSGTPALPNGTTATTQTVGDSTAKLATDAFVIANAGAISFTSNEGVGANGSSGYAPVPEVQYKTSGGTTAYACQEDHNAGIYDPRCTRYAGGIYGGTPAAAAQAMSNQMACDLATNVVKHAVAKWPQGNYPMDQLVIAPGSTWEGTPNSQGGTLWFSVTANHQTAVAPATMTLTCNGTSQTDSLGGTLFEHFTLNGCATGGCSNAPGDTASYLAGGPGNTGIQMSSTGGIVAFTSANNFGGYGIRFDGQDTKWFHNTETNDLSWFYDGYYKGVLETATGTEVNTTTSGSTGSVALSWAPVAGAAGYIVYRGTATNAESTFFATGTNSFTDTGTAGTAAVVTNVVTSGVGAPGTVTPTPSSTGGTLAANTYYYKVSSYTADGWHGQAELVGADTMADWGEIYGRFDLPNTLNYHHISDFLIAGGNGHFDHLWPQLGQVGIAIPFGGGGGANIENVRVDFTRLEGIYNADQNTAIRGGILGSSCSASNAQTINTGQENPFFAGTCVQLYAVGGNDRLADIQFYEWGGFGPSFETADYLTAGYATNLNGVAQSVSIGLFSGVHFDSTGAIGNVTGPTPSVQGLSVLNPVDSSPINYANFTNVATGQDFYINTGNANVTILYNPPFIYTCNNQNINLGTASGRLHFQFGGNSIEATQVCPTGGLTNPMTVPFLLEAPGTVPALDIIQSGATGYSQIAFGGTSSAPIAQYGLGNPSETFFGVANKFFWYNDSTSSMAATLDLNGNFISSSVKTAVYTVATLPSASTLGAGAQVAVSDGAGSPPTCTGGGSTYEIAVSNGTTWVCGGAAGYVNPMTTVGDVLYGGTSGVATRLGGNTAATDAVLISHGTGSAAAAPTFGNAPVLSAANMVSFPTFNQNTTGTAANLSGSQTAKFFYAAPNASAGTASFRAIVASDVPTLNQSTTGTAGGLTGTPSISITNLLGSGTVTLTGIESVSGSTCLQINASGVVSNTGSACGTGGGGFTNPMTTLGDIIYATTGGTAQRLAGNTTTADEVLVSTGTGSAAQAPVYSNAPVLSAANMVSFPTFNQNTTGTAANLSGSQTAKFFYAAPNATSGTASFRAIVASDVPTLNQSTTGTAAGLSSTLAIASGGTGQTSASAAFNALSPLTTLGDVLYGGTSGAGTRLAGNTAATDAVLVSHGTGSVSAAPTFSNAPALSAANMSSFPTFNQNTTGTSAGISGSQTANFFYAAPNGSAGTATFRAIVSADIPTLNQNTSGTAANLSGTPALPNGTTGTTQTTGDSSTKLATDAFVIANAGVGSVTSVALTAPTWLAVGGTPVTGAGTLALTAATGQTSHQVIGTCGSATSFAPCALVAADIPTLNQNTTGTAAGLSATLAIASGGTGQTSASAAFNALSPMTTLGDVLYGGTSGAGTRLAGNTAATDQVLVSHGTGTVSAAPTFSNAPALSAANMSSFPTFNQNTTGTAANLSGTPALPNGTTGTTQTVGDSTTKLATDAFVIANAGVGSVTSVALTMPTWLAVSGTPVTSAGTLAVTAATGQTSHQVIGTCGSATSFAPCALVAADIPTLNQNTSGTAANLSGTPALPNGTTATTQTTTDTSTDLATDAFVANNLTALLAATNSWTGANTFQGVFQGPLGIATSGSGNFNSASHTFFGSFWNGSAAQSIQWAMSHVVGAGTTPNSVLLFQGPGLPSGTVPFVRFAATPAATSGLNINSPGLQLYGNYWTSTASATDSWTLTDSLAAGANPLSTLIIAHAGSSGGGSVQMPALTITAPLGIGSGGTGQTGAAASFNALSPLTTLGDVLYGGTSGAGTRLAGNTAANDAVLISHGTGSVSAAPTFSNAPVLSAANMVSFPTFNQNTTGTAANLSGTPALPNGTTGTTQTVGDNTTKLATDAFVIANAGSGFSNPMTTLGDMMYGGTSGVATRIAGPTSGTIPLILTSTPSGGAAVAPAWTVPGIGGRTVTTTSDTIAAADRGQSVTYNSASAVAVTLTSAATLLNKFDFVTGNLGAGSVTFTPGAGTINGSSTLVVAQNESCAINSQDDTNYVARCGYSTTGGGITALTGDATASGSGSVAATVVKVNGVSYPATPSTNTYPAVSASNTVTYVSTNHAVGWSFGDVATGSALTTSAVGYVTVPFACTIKGYHIMADAGTVTIKTARVNGGTALPTVASNSISTSGVSLSTGTKVDSTTVSDFTSTAVAANDTLGFFITTVATAKQITFQLDCAQ